MMPSPIITHEAFEGMPSTTIKKSAGPGATMPLLDQCLITAKVERLTEYSGIWR